MSGPFSATVQATSPALPPSILRGGSGAANGSIGGISPVDDDDAGPPLRRKAVTVPVSHPRYERKSRLNRAISVTDSASEDTGRSPGELLTMRSRECLKVSHGPVAHTESISYRAYACYRHGSRIHTQSVGYSSDGDLVLHRRDVVAGNGYTSDSGADRRSPAPSGGAGGSTTTYVEGAVCLNPRARAVNATVDGEAPSARWARRISRMAKYPGVRCPKNRKIRNRLINDHMAAPSQRALFEMAQEDSDPDGLREPAAPAFEGLPEALEWLADTTEDRQAQNLARLGLAFDHLGGIVRAGAAAGPRAPYNKAATGPDSAAFRFGQLQGRLKAELQHAMSTDYMPGFMADLEGRFEQLIQQQGQQQDGRSVDVVCKDGYGRLVTHGVAAYYKLHSQSVDAPGGGQRLTRVSLPRKPVGLPDLRLTAFLRGGQANGGSTGTSPTAGPAAPPAPPRRGASDGDSEDAEAASQRRVLGRRKRFKKHPMRRSTAPLAGMLMPSYAPFV